MLSRCCHKHDEQYRALQKISTLCTASPGQRALPNLFPDQVVKQHVPIVAANESGKFANAFFSDHVYEGCLRAIAQYKDNRQEVIIFRNIVASATQMYLCTLVSTQPHLHDHSHEVTCTHSHTPGGRWADRIGVISTAICAIHCMLTPIYTLIKAFSFPDWMEWVDWMVLPLSIFGVLHLSKHYQDNKWKLVVWGGWTAMALGTLLEHVFAPAFIIALTGAGVLLWAYIKHLRRNR